MGWASSYRILALLVFRKELMSGLKKCLCGADAETVHKHNDYGEHYRTRCSRHRWCESNLLVEAREYFRADAEESWNRNITSTQNRDGH